MIDKEYLNIILFLIRRATGIQYELKDINSAMMNSLVRAIDFNQPLPNTLRKINSLITEEYGKLETSLYSSLSHVAEVVVQAEKILKPIAITKKLINDSLAHVMPSSNISTLDLIKRTKGVTIQSVKNYTIQAYNESWTQKEFRDAIRTTEAQLNNNLSTIARTSVNAVSNNAKIKLYENNSDIVDRVLFSAFLDSRTSNICKSLDGSAYKIKNAPVLPLHPNERSQLVPILKGESIQEVQDVITPRMAVEAKGKTVFEKQGLKTRTGKVRKPSITDRSPLQSVKTNKKNYEEWIRSQPKYYQEAILGKRATKALRSGKKLRDVLYLDPVTKKQLSKAIKT